MNYNPHQQNTVAVYHAMKADMRRQLAEVAPADGVYYIVSIENKYILAKGGQVSPVTLDNAARCIVEQTHQLASSEQIERYHADQASRVNEYALIEAKRNKNVVFMMPNNDPAILSAQQALSGSSIPRKGKEG